MASPLPWQKATRKTRPPLLRRTPRGCPCTVPGEFFTPEDVLPSPPSSPSSPCCPVLRRAAALTSAHQLVGGLKPAASFALEALPGPPLPLGTARKPPEPHQKLDVCTASPKLPKPSCPFSLPSAGAVGSLGSRWLGVDAPRLRLWVPKGSRGKADAVLASLPASVRAHGVGTCARAGEERRSGGVGRISRSVCCAPPLEGSRLRHGAQLLVDFLTQVTFKPSNVGRPARGLGKAVSEPASASSSVGELVLFLSHLYKLERSDPRGRAIRSGWDGCVWHLWRAGTLGSRCWRARICTSAFRGE